MHTKDFEFDTFTAKQLRLVSLQKSSVRWPGVVLCLQAFLPFSKYHVPQMPVIHLIVHPCAATMKYRCDAVLTYKLAYINLIGIHTTHMHTHTHTRIHSHRCSCRSACFEGPLRMNEKVLQTQYDATRHTIMLGPASFVASSCCVSLVFHMNQLPVIHIGALNLFLLFQ